MKSSTGSDLRLGQAADVLAKLKDDVVLKFLEGKGTALSWNHGKILAVNGKTLMTGGANFAHTNASNQYSIIEQSCKMKGDAAVSAHVWQDYFFS